ncbi:DUF6894 family protein [Methylobacterium tarhaniae]|uniref:DUF6894 family protein n=1 Tax=Methylobacterium tarhaniae TaxID=1187852 RepID=UPI003CFF99E7
MHRFFFDIIDGNSVLIDDVGTEFNGLAEARAEVIAFLPNLLRDKREISTPSTLTVLLRDSVGIQRYRASISVEASIVS